MARTVDPVKRRERRLHIVDAAITCFAAKGFDRTTTAEICREAGISSGSLFHEFPTKASILTEIFVEDVVELTAFFAGLDPDADPLDGVLAYVDRAADEAADPRIPGLLAAVLGYAGDPDFAAAVAASEKTSQDGLRALFERAHATGRIASDLGAAQLAGWVALLVDGFYSRILVDPAFDLAKETPVLRRLVERLAEPV